MGVQFLPGTGDLHVASNVSFLLGPIPHAGEMGKKHITMAYHLVVNKADKPSQVLVTPNTCNSLEVNFPEKFHAQDKLHRLLMDDGTHWDPLGNKFLETSTFASQFHQKPDATLKVKSAYLGKASCETSIAQSRPAVTGS